jgi:O-antigen ligase
MQNWLLGYGLYAGFLEISGSSLEQPGLGGTHSGYLDMLVSFGIVGSCIGMLCLAWLLVRSIAVLLSVDNTVEAFKTFPACATIYVILHNVVESSLISGNCLPPLMLAVTAGVVARSAIQRTLEKAFAHRRPTGQSINILR